MEKTILAKIKLKGTEHQIAEVKRLIQSLSALDEVASVYIQENK